jgi:hypothetical protein
MNIDDKISQLNAIEKERTAILEALEEYFRARCKGQPFSACIKILSQMPECLQKFDIVSFYHALYHSKENKQIASKDEMSKHLIDYCKDYSLNDAIALLDEVSPSTIDREYLIYHFTEHLK